VRCGISHEALIPNIKISLKSQISTHLEVISGKYTHIIDISKICICIVYFSTKWAKCAHYRRHPCIFWSLVKTLKLGGDSKKIKISKKFAKTKMRLSRKSCWETQDLQCLVYYEQRTVVTLFLLVAFARRVDYSLEVFHMDEADDFHPFVDFHTG